jgi:hypothetical protein
VEYPKEKDALPGCPFACKELREFYWKDDSLFKSFFGSL